MVGARKKEEDRIVKTALREVQKMINGAIMRIKTHQIILKEDHLACKIVKLKTAIVKIKIKEVNQKTNQGNSNN